MVGNAEKLKILLSDIKKRYAHLDNEVDRKITK
jgi:hypothetical protein